MTTITIKELDKPDLPICKMNCDSDLAEHLNDYELTKLAFSKFSTNLLIGKPKSGKTSLLYSFFKGEKKKNKIFNTNNDFTGLITRLTLGLILFPHGAQKMLGWAPNIDLNEGLKMNLNEFGQIKW